MAALSTLPPDLARLDRGALRQLRGQVARELHEADMERTRLEADTIRERCRSLAEFVREAWPVLEPAQPYVHNQHIDVICQHLEAVVDGRILRLIINIPPLMGKSILVSVMFPMWCWATRGAGMRFLGVSHEQGLAVRDNLKCRRLATSEWFQTLWPNVRVTTDQNEKMNFENSDGGFRQVATMSNITGRRGDVVLLDDLLSVENANSEVERDKVNRWLREALPLRINNPEKSAMILIMQRVHQNDATGFILSQGWGWEHLMLPMRFEPRRASATSLGKNDWRTEEGQLLFPKRFGERFTANLEAQLRAYAAAGQLQQNPVPREGGMFDVDKLDVVDAAPGGGDVVAGWDIAGSKRKTSPYTVRVLFKRVGGDVYVLDVKRRRTNPTELMAMVESVSKDDARDYPGLIISLPQDPGAAGKVVKWSWSSALIGLRYKVTPETGDKETRAQPFAAHVGASRVHLVRGEWNSEYVEEHRGFPTGYKDQVDASSRAFGELVAKIAAPVNAAPETVDVEDVEPTPDSVDAEDPW